MVGVNWVCVVRTLLALGSFSTWGWFELLPTAPPRNCLALLPPGNDFMRWRSGDDGWESWTRFSYARGLFLDEMRSQVILLSACLMKCMHTMICDVTFLFAGFISRVVCGPLSMLSCGVLASGGPKKGLVNMSTPFFIPGSVLLPTTFFPPGFFPLFFSYLFFHYNNQGREG